MHGKHSPAVHGHRMMNKQEVINPYAESFASDYQGMVEKYCDLTIVTYDKDQPHVCIWRRKLKNPSYHYRFETPALRAKFIEHRKADALRQAQEKELCIEEQKRQQAETLAKIKCGDIFVSTWGFEQTNADFYQVTKISGSSIEIQRVSAEIKETGFMCGTSTPIPDKFIGPAMRKRIGGEGHISINSYSSASLWNGKPVSCSWYG